MTEIKVHKNQMTNSHILVNAFDYFEPVSVEEALQLLTRYGGRAQALAGGTHLITMLKMEREAPDAIISLGRVPSLDAIQKNDQNELCIGAAATIHAIRHHPLVQTSYSALAEACAAFGSTQIQIMGTLGGNICNGSPASDTVPALLLFDAELLLKSPRGERRMKLADFLLGPGKTERKEDELLLQIILPPQPLGASSAFIKISRVAADLAKASIAAMLVRNGNTIAECRLALGSVAPTVVRMPRAEAFLKGKTFSDEVLEQAGQMVSEDIRPIDDFRSTAQYRRKVCRAITVDVLKRVWERAVSPRPAPSPSVGVAAIQKRSGTPHNIAAHSRQEVQLTINGEHHLLWVAPNELLINVLRERMHLTGTKYGCGLGECGACTVLVNGKAALSCLILAASAEGKEIVTIEGLKGTVNGLDPLQDTFVAEAAYQCGYCTPGFILTAKSLLAENPHPKEEEVRDYVKGNRCRCTGYVSIVRAIMKYAETNS